ncbi:MAG: hypothetical protein A2Y38_23505 [Spirochaetes bacterium GWB1_59_5]|nr:MAG: hypothetical protein A2Y38_23505 [Spirochaetes bacterium GWB1_59_5]
MPAKTEAVNGSFSGAEDEVLTEAHDQAAEFLLATPIGSLVVDEAGFGSAFPVTPFMSWDKGEISGPYDNWGRVRLTVEHLVLAIESLNDLQRAVFFTEIWRRRHEDNQQKRGR